MGSGSGISPAPSHFRRLRGYSGVLFAAVGTGEVAVRTDGYKPSRVDFRMGHIIMPFNMVEIHGGGDALGLI